MLVPHPLHGQTRLTDRPLTDGKCNTCSSCSLRSVSVFVCAAQEESERIKKKKRAPVRFSKKKENERRVKPMQTNTRASQIRPAGNIPIRAPEAKLFLFWSRSIDAGGHDQKHQTCSNENMKIRSRIISSSTSAPRRNWKVCYQRFLEMISSKKSSSYGNLTFQEIGNIKKKKMKSSEEKCGHFRCWKETK